MAFPWGAVISAGAGLLGGAINRQTSTGRDDAAEAFNWNAQLQREFAQNGIRWRVEDAKAAGVHPLFALGAQVTPGSPQAIDFGTSQPDYASMGQDIGRAVYATMSGSQRNEAKMQALAVERGELENTLLRAQIAKLSQVGPALPDGSFHDGMTPSYPVGGGVNAVPAEVTAVHPDQPYHQQGVFGDTRFVRTGEHLYKPVPAMGLDGDMDLPMLEYVQWLWRNQGVQSLGLEHGREPPRSLLPDSSTWAWSWSNKDQAWQAVFVGTEDSPRVPSPSEVNPGRSLWDELKNRWYNHFERGGTRRFNERR